MINFFLEFPGPLYQNEVIFPLTQIKLIFTTWPHFESEGFWNSKVGYVFQFLNFAPYVLYIHTRVMKPVRNTNSEPGLPVAQMLTKCFVK